MEWTELSNPSKDEEGTKDEEEKEEEDGRKIIPVKKR